MIIIKVADIRLRALAEAAGQAWSGNTQAELLATAHGLANMDASNFEINGVAQPRIDALIFSLFPMENMLTHEVSNHKSCWNPRQQGL